MNLITLTGDDVARFAAASADRNPLHLDPDYCRRTPYGRPIVHGALAVIATAPHFDSLPGKMDQGLRIVFRQPMFVDVPYEVRSGEQQGDRTLYLQWGDLCLLSMSEGSFARTAERATGGPSTWPSASVQIDADRPPELARALSAADLAALDGEQGEYVPGWSALRALAERFGFRHGDSWLACLAWVSFWAGMRTPGRDALLCGVRIQREAASAPPSRSPERLSYRVHSPLIDRRTGAVGQVAHVAIGDASFRIEVDSVLRRAAPQASPTTVAPHLHDSRRLTGEVVAVVGGSRGLGRALSLALVRLGATVLVVHRESSDRVGEMQSQLPSDRDRLLAVKCDAGDPRALESAMDQVPGRLAGLILCAAPAIPALPLNAAATDEMLSYLDSSVRLAWSPLTICAPRLRDDAFVVFASSMAIDEPPPWWPHYVAAKSAIEGIARFTAAQRPWKVTIARLPRLWTELSGAVTGAIGAASTESVAAHLLRHVFEDGASDNGATDAARSAKLLKAEQLL